MNTTPDPPPSNTDSRALDVREPHEALTRALASAQEEIAELKDKRREERLAWIVLIVLIVDAFVLLRANNLGGPLIIGLIQIAGLSVLANRLGVEEFARLFGRMIDRVTNKAFGGD